MTLSVAVMAHPKREEFIPGLLDRLGITDDRVIWDQDDDRWDTGRRAMLHHDPDATHHMVIQDDALVCRDLIPGIERALKHIPSDAAMCLYAGKTAKFWEKVARAGVQVPSTPCWMVTQQVHWGVGLVIPTRLIREMVAWCDLRREIPNYDKRISRWCEHSRTDVWYPLPSLVEHRGSPSLVPGRSGGRGRRAKSWVGESASALTMDWHRPQVAVGRPVKLSAAVMAHPVREAQVAELLDHLDRHVPVSWDTAGPPSSDPRQRWATGRRAWEMHDPQADWHMVIQDDAIVVPDLLAGLEAALEWVPERTIVQPYVGTKRPNQIAVAARVVAANDMDASWLSMRSLMWGVAIVVPVAEIAGMLAWCDQIERNSYAYDKRIGVYWRDERRWRTHYTWPALVDHRLALSICGHGHSDRRAHRLWERSALERDWSGPVVTDGRPYGRNRPVKSPKVRMTHPRGRGARLIAENDVPRWKGRGWRIEDEPVEAPVNDVSTDTSSGPTEAGTEEPTSDEDADDEELDAPEGMEIDPSAVRAWAAENDIDVSARGKLPQRVIAAYEAAHDA